MTPYVSCGGFHLQVCFTNWSPLGKFVNIFIVNKICLLLHNFIAGHKGG